MQYSEVGLKEDSLKKNSYCLHRSCLCGNRIGLLLSLNFGGYTEFWWYIFLKHCLCDAVSNRWPGYLLGNIREPIKKDSLHLWM